MITNKWWDYMLNDLISHVYKCVVTLTDGSTYNYDIYKTNIDIDNRKIMIDFYIQDEFWGVIAKKTLIDVDGNELDIKETEIDKDEEGLYVRFAYQFTEEEIVYE